MPIFLVSFLIAIIPVLGQSDVQIEVDPYDSPILITGWLGEDVFEGNLRLTALNGDIEEFIFLASDLTLEKGDDIIGRQHVNLVGDPTLSVGIPHNFQVMVTGLKEPGTYKGEIEILIKGQNRNEALVIPLTVIARARPALTPLPGTAQVQLKLVNPQSFFIDWLHGLDNFLAYRLLPKSAFLDSWQLQFQNTVNANITILETTAVVLGEQTCYQLTEEALTFPKGQQIIPAKQIGSLSLTIERKVIPPDHYMGSIFLTLDGLDEQLIIPVDLSVRIGPFWPGVILFIGISLGRVFKWIQEKDSIQKEEARKKLDELQEKRHMKILKNGWTAVTGLSLQIRIKGGIMLLLRGLLYLCLIILLIFVGMDKFYISEGAYFGAKPFNDYFGLIFWGLSADVASRTLGTLRAPDN